MGELETLSVMGLPIHWGARYEDWLLSQHHQGLGAHVVTLNAEMAMQADQNPALKAVLCKADLAIPDGAGIVLYFRVKGKRIQRYPGIELAESLLQRLEAEHSAFFLGAAPGVAKAAAQTWQARQPQLNIVGVQAIAKWLHPELFADIDPHATLATMYQRFQPFDANGIYWMSAP